MAVPANFDLPLDVKAETRLLRWPIWCQLRDPLPDGSQDPDAATDCGEECAAMVIDGIRGVPFSAGCLRQALSGQTMDGRTTASALTYLLNAFKIGNTTVVEDSQTSLQAVRSAIARGCGCIILGRWESFDALHWMVAVGLKDAGLWVNDPWTGSRRHVTFEDWHARYAGQMIRIDVPA